MILHASLTSENVVVCAADTDVLILLIHAYPLITNTSKWAFRYEKGKYADIKIICSYFGKLK